MKSMLHGVLWMLVPAIAIASGGDPVAKVQDHATTGDMASTVDLGCVPLGAIRNVNLPADLYRAAATCIERGDYLPAVDLVALAGSYAHYDTLRVAEQTARQAKDELRAVNLDGLNPKREQAFVEVLFAIAGDPSKLAALCTSIRGVGAPAYAPDYMIRYGMQALRGAEDDGLVPGFDASVAWDATLDGFLHCPKP